MLAEQLDAFLGNFASLSSRIRHLDFDTSGLGDRINARCSYIAFKDGALTFDEFIDVLFHQIVSFCLPKSEILAAHSSLARVRMH